MSLGQLSKYAVPAMSFVAEKITESYRSMIFSLFPYSLSHLQMHLLQKLFIFTSSQTLWMSLACRSPQNFFSFNRYNFQWFESNSPDCFHSQYKMALSNAWTPLPWLLYSRSVLTVLTFGSRLAAAPSLSDTSQPFTRPSGTSDMGVVQHLLLSTSLLHWQFLEAIGLLSLMWRFRISLRSNSKSVL